MAQWVKDLALSVLWQGFDSWPGCSQKKKKKSSSCDSADEEPHTVSLRTRVQSLASISGLRIWHCHKLWHRSWMRLGSGIAVAVVSAGSCSSDSTPSLEISTCHRCGPKKQTTTTATRSYHYTSLEWLKPSVLLTTPNAGGAVEQQELPSTAVGNEKWCSRFQRLAVS